MTKWILFAVTTFGLMPPAAAAVSVVPLDLDPARIVIGRQCKLSAWQYALTVNPANKARVELSPTLPQSAVVCVYQVLSDARIPLDRPPPVESVQKVVKKPRMIY